jgi:hypothetical protein
MNEPDPLADVRDQPLDAQLARGLVLLDTIDDRDRYEQMRQELDRLNRKKVSYFAADPRHATWIPLPQVNFVIPRSLPDEAVREFSSMMVLLIARALEELYGAEAEQIEFVAICSIETASDRTGFRFYVPRPEVVGYVSERLPPRVTAADTKAAVDAITSDVRRSCVLVPGQLLPVVYSFDPQNRTLQITNENQLNAPDQFLEPRRCRTTSGLLNCIGAMSARSLGSQSGLMIELNNFEALMNQGLEPWFSWFYSLFDTGAALDPERLLVNPDNPEEYVNRYDPASP